MTLEKPKSDWLEQLGKSNGIPLQDLVEYYEKKIVDPAFTSAFKTKEELEDYIDTLIVTHIQEFHSAVMTELEVLTIVSTVPKMSKAENMYNNHVFLCKRPGDGQKVKWMNVVNLEESGHVVRLNKLSTGTIKVNISGEEEQTINAFSKGASEFKEHDLTWVPKDEAGKKEYIRKLIKKVEIADAGKNLSAKTADGKGVIPWSLRLIRGTISQHRITKKEDEKTGKTRVTGIINIVDRSIATNADFFKQKTVQNPKKPGETMIQYGGFSGFCEVEDITDKGKGTEAEFIGYITAANQMNVATILPILTIAPKKATEKLQKPGTAVAPEVPAEINPAMI